jgi:hypothetical protein
VSRDVVITHVNGLDLHQWLRLAENLACSLEEIVNAKDIEDIDWAGARQDLTRYWEARKQAESIRER